MKAISALVLFLLFLFCFSFAKPAFAASISATSVPSTIDQSQEFQVNANLSCSGCGDSYLRGVFYPSGTSYFGYTQENSGNWSNAPGGNCTTYFKVSQSDLIEGSWSGILKFKPDKDSSYYTGPGEYFFKIGRYTPSCSSPSVWSQEIIIAITGPTPTPTSVPTSTPTSTPQPSPTPTPTPTPTKTPTSKPSLTPTLKPSVSPAGTLDTNVLGEASESATISPSGTQSPKGKEIVLSSRENNIGKTLIMLGFVFILACAILFSWPFIKKRIKRNEE